MNQYDWKDYLIIMIVLCLWLVMLIFGHDAKAATVNFKKDITAYNLIVDAEGYRDGIYKDSLGNDTCGYGFLASLHDCQSLNNRQLADYHLNNLIKSNMFHVKRYYNTHNTVVTAVLSDLYYNIGNRLHSFKKMRYALNIGDYKLAAYELENSLWCRQVKTRCTRNVRLINDTLN